MNLALIVLSDLPKTMTWALGGGTGLALHLNHRISYDIDIFFEHPKALKEIIKNPETKKITPDWQFPGNYLKLVREEGEIDFILAADITNSPHKLYNFNGTQINLETPQEIIAKKIIYRGHNFTLRDTIDLVSTLKVYPNLFTHYVDLFNFKYNVKSTLQRIQFLKINEADFDKVIIRFDNDITHNMFDIAINHMENYLAQQNTHEPKKCNQHL